MGSKNQFQYEEEVDAQMEEISRVSDPDNMVESDWIEVDDRALKMFIKYKGDVGFNTYTKCVVRAWIDYFSRKFEYKESTIRKV